MSNWSEPIGSESIREEISSKYGGGLQSGIAASRDTPNVIVFTDPEEATENGYNFDGWVEDEIFQYTGEGQLGDQVWKRGNKRLGEHRSTQDAIRLFVANGIHPGTKATKKHLYLGEFALDETEPFLRAECPDRKGDDRVVYVFRLRPLSEALRRAEDNAQLPLGVTTDPVQIEKLPIDDEISVYDVAVQSQHKPDFERRGSQSGEGQRREASLVLRYKAHLEKQGHEVGSRRIKVPGLTAALELDLFDVTDGELVEAKGESTRANIRYALGQVLDYRRYVQPESCAVLLPSRPSDDLINLLVENGVSCVHENGDGDFLRIGAVNDS